MAALSIRHFPDAIFQLTASKKVIGSTSGDLLKEPTKTLDEFSVP
jgi:hypothetical protein